MKKQWQYRILKVPDPTPVELFNKEGRGGWELVTITQTTDGRVAVFKREGSAPRPGYRT